MKEIHLDMQTTGGLGSSGIRRSYTILILDDGKADEAYEHIKAAMAKYREHGNDRDQAVEFDFVEGKSNIKIAAILGVTIFSLGGDDEIELMVAKARRDKAAKDRLKAEGLWEEPKEKTA